jgi:hypothetical protein
MDDDRDGDLWYRSGWRMKSEKIRMTVMEGSKVHLERRIPSIKYYLMLTVLAGQKQKEKL